MSRILVCNRRVLFSTLSECTSQSKATRLPRACVRHQSTAATPERSSTLEATAAPSSVAEESASPPPHSPASIPRSSQVLAEESKPSASEAPPLKQVQKTRSGAVASGKKRGSLKKQIKDQQRTIDALNTVLTFLLRKGLAIVQTPVDQRKVLSKAATITVLREGARRDLALENQLSATAKELADEKRKKEAGKESPTVRPSALNPSIEKRRKEGGKKSAAVRPPKFDPSIELLDYKGPTNLPELAGVRAARIPLEGARQQRTRNLIDLLGNIDMARRQLIREDMLPKTFDILVLRHQRWIQKKAAEWLDAQEEYKEQQLPKTDPKVKFVHPSHVPGRRMGPPEREAEWKIYEELVEQHAEEFQITWTRSTTPSHMEEIRPSPTNLLQTGQQIRQYSTSSSSATRPAYKSRPAASNAAPFPRKPSHSSVKALQENPSRASPSGKPSSSSSILPPAPPEAWKIQKRALDTKFATGWSPRRKLSPDAILHLRHLHATNPTLYTTPLLASTFKTSPEAIRRILKSKWLSNASEDKVQERRERWAKRHDAIWDVKSELGLRPRRREGREHRVEDADSGGEKIEAELRAEEVLRRGRLENPIYADLDAAADADMASGRERGTAPAAAAARARERKGLY